MVSLIDFLLLWHESVLPCACDKAPYDLAVRLGLCQVLDVCSLQVNLPLSTLLLQKGYTQTHLTDNILVMIWNAHLTNAPAN